MYEVYSQKKPRFDKGESFSLPSLTDQLADEPLEKLVARYMIAGNRLEINEADLVVSDETTVKDVEEAFNDSATDDVVALDRADAFEVLEQASRASDVLNRIKSSAKDKPSTASGALEDKDSSSSLPDDGKTKN